MHLIACPMTAVICAVYCNIASGQRVMANESARPPETRHTKAGRREATLFGPLQRSVGGISSIGDRFPVQRPYYSPLIRGAPERSRNTLRRSRLFPIGSQPMFCGRPSALYRHKIARLRATLRLFQFVLDDLALFQSPASLGQR